MKNIKILPNSQREYDNKENLPINFHDVENFHNSMAAYKKTPLHKLNSFASQFNLKNVYVKDESFRFGLNAFKGLGVSYALHKIMENTHDESYTFVSCTDGNHGKALAWQARELGHKSIIFMPKGSEIRRVRAIEEYGAKVIVTEMNYDDTVRYASEYSQKTNGYLVQDTSLPDYTEIPKDIMMGYSTMVREALEEMEEKPTHVFIQAGVGSLAGGAIWYLVNKYSDHLPLMGVIEADSVACIYESVKENKLVSIGDQPYTAMAGLNCGEANFSSFPLLKAKTNFFIRCRDEVTFLGMERSKNPIPGDCKFSSGESGAVSLGFIEEIMSNEKYMEERKILNLNSNSIILIFNTEGELRDD